MKPGPRNLLTDVGGLRVGNASSVEHRTGVSVVLADLPNRAAVHVAGGAPGTRETDALAPENLVEGVDALVLAGGSAFGLDAAGGVQNALARMGRGFAVGEHRVPIVPAAILFDLANGGASWSVSPFAALGTDAVEAAEADFALGSVGAGTGAITGGANGGERLGLKGGLGSASAVLPYGTVVGALVAVNALGAPCDADGRFFAAPFELNGEFGGRDASTAALGHPLPIKGREPGTATTIGVVATDANLSKAQCKRLAVAAHDGYALALWPAHTPLDGDLVFAVSTGSEEPSDIAARIDLGAAAAAVMARAVARAVFEATPAEGDLVPTFRTVHG